MPRPPLTASLRSRASSSWWRTGCCRARPRTWRSSCTKARASTRPSSATTWASGEQALRPRECSPSPVPPRPPELSALMGALWCGLPGPVTCLLPSTPSGQMAVCHSRSELRWRSLHSPRCPSLHTGDRTRSRSERHNVSSDGRSQQGLQSVSSLSRDEFNIKVLQAFVELHEFADLNLVQALR